MTRIQTAFQSHSLADCLELFSRLIERAEAKNRQDRVYFYVWLLLRRVSQEAGISLKEFGKVKALVCRGIEIDSSILYRSLILQWCLHLGLSDRIYPYLKAEGESLGLSEHEFVRVAQWCRCAIIRARLAHEASAPTMAKEFSLARALWPHAGMMDDDLEEFEMLSTRVLGSEPPDFRRVIS